MSTIILLVLIVVLGGVLWLLWRARLYNAQLREAVSRANEINAQLTAEQQRIDQRVNAMIDAPPHALLVLDRNAVIVRANRRATEMIGPQIVGQTIIKATRSHEIDNAVQAALARQQIEERPVTWNVRPYLARGVPSGDGGLVLALEDQTDRQRSERMRRDFVANISHELRTPLASVRLLIETLLNGALEEPDLAARMLNQMLGEVDSITQLAQELLDLSMIESGQMPMRFKCADLGEIVAEQIIHYEPLAQQKQLSVKNEVPEAVLVEVDQKMIGRVLGNLIHNAIKFTPERGALSIGAQPVDDRIQVSVADSGAGIPAEDLPRIFERFYKVDRARGKSGTGLGLAIARHVVEAHGGKIWAESVEGKGATFYFTLPRGK